MSKPKAYDPQDGYQYHILCRNPSISREWEHCDYAKDRTERSYLVGEYRLAYGAGWEFTSILQPRKHWPKTVRCSLCSKKIVEEDALYIAGEGDKPRPYCVECEKIKEPGDPEPITV